MPSHEIAQLCRQNNWTLATWDIDRGLGLNGQTAEARAVPSAADPLSAVKSLNALATPDGTAILVLRNYHRFLGSAEIVQALDSAISKGKQDRTFIVILSPVVQIPVELERAFVVVEHDLPSREQLEQIARNIATEPGDLPEGDDLGMVLDAAAGLTRVEAENAFSLSLVRHGRVVPEVLWGLKSQMLKKSGLLTLHRGGETFTDLGGLDALKGFTRRALGSRKGSVRARGVLLLGVPGTGKSAFAKALGNETGRPTLVLDVGSLMGSLVGQTEERTRQALRIVDAMAPCVLFIDEIEKALAGVQSSGPDRQRRQCPDVRDDAGWLNDHESDVFVVATSNDVSKLPPEFSGPSVGTAPSSSTFPASGNGMPSGGCTLEKFGLDPAQPRPNDRDWTGAEIKSCCRLAALLDVPLVESARNIVPVAVTAGESVERLRNWASGRCLSADRPGLYTRCPGGPGGPNSWPDFSVN